MKLTRHNGRAGKNDVYNPKHNDRRFDVVNSEHIDMERAKQNIYWDCYIGYSSALTRGQDKENDYSFERIEQLYFFVPGMQLCAVSNNYSKHWGKFGTF